MANNSSWLGSGDYPFGTDWPGVPSIAANIEAIRALSLSEEATAKILGENVARILGIEK